MAKITAPSNVQISSMQEKKVLAASNAMTPGSGTAWEDLATQGLFAGFFKTALGVMFQPGKVLWQIRRPETTRETTWFVLGCSFFWSISIIIHAVIYYYTKYHDPQHYTVDTTQYIVNTGLWCVLIMAGAWVGWRLVSVMLYKMTAFDMVGKVPKVLVTNVLGYTFAPSILAVIPYAGPPLAVVWIVILWGAASYSRLRVKLVAAIIGTVLSTIATGAIVTGLYFGLWGLWTQLMGYDSITIVEPPKVSTH